MRTAALELLACPSCGGSLVADGTAPAADGHVMSGVLACGCGLRFPIRRGVPRLFTVDPDSKVMPDDVAIAQRAGLHWVLFDPRGAAHEQLFFDSVAPIRPRDLTDKDILLAGAGNGRIASLVARYGPRNVVALERSAAADLAFANTRHLRDVHVVQGGLVEAPVARAFDLVLGGQAVHREQDPVLALRSMWRRAVVGGRVAFHVPSFEANQWALSMLEPVRATLTSRLPEQTLYWATLGPALAAAVLVRACRVAAIAQRMPYGELLARFARTPVRELHRAIFAELASPVAWFAKRDELLSYLNSAELEELEIEDLAGCAWRATARVASAQVVEASDPASVRGSS